MKTDLEIIAESLSFTEPVEGTELIPSSVAEAANVGLNKRTSVFLYAWKAMGEDLYLNHAIPWSNLPPFVKQYLRLLFDCNQNWALRAVATGDVPFFIAWLFRFDQIDLTMLDAGYSLADRTPLIRYRAAIDGYRAIAEKRLRKLGGVWPPAPQKSAPAPRKKKRRAAKKTASGPTVSKPRRRRKPKTAP